MALCILLAAAVPAGGVSGRVVWAGDVPTVDVIPAAIPDGVAYRFTTMPNPFAPVEKDGGLGGAVVSLTGATGEPRFPPATVEQSGHRLQVRQGGAAAAVGLVGVGDAVTVVSRDPGPATIRLRGAAFATLPFPGPDKPLSRKFDKPGVVEITSGTMLAWAACDLIVCDHPYNAVTAADGRFNLPGVPPGEYTLTCRVRSWKEVGHDRDPETGLVSRRRFAPPVVLTAKVRVPPTGDATHTFTVSSTSFPPP